MLVSSFLGTVFSCSPLTAMLKHGNASSCHVIAAVNHDEPVQIFLYAAFCLIQLLKTFQATPHGVVTSSLKNTAFKNLALVLLK